MVDTVEISRVTIRDNLSVDVSVWMNHPDDWDFRPALSLSNNEFIVSDIISGNRLASINYPMKNQKLFIGIESQN